MIYSPNKNSRAFTLVEMIVSLAVFSIVAVVALGALTKIVSANRKAQTLQTSITNLNFALETMSRELRVSPYYDCQSGTYSNSGTLLASHDCAGGTGSAVGFLSSKVLTTGNGAPCNAIYVYAFVAKSNGYDLQKGVQTDCGVPVQANAFSSVIDPNVVITGYYLNVLNGGPYGGVSYKYPLATIRISGYAGTKEREKTLFDVQTSVSPRTI